MESRSQPIVQAVTIHRDRKTELQQLLPLARQLEPGMSFVADPDPRHAFSVDTTEVTRGAYAILLQSIRDPQLRAEMLPKDWGGMEESSMPVTGVSLRQARTAAASLPLRHLRYETAPYAFEGRPVNPQPT